MNSWDSLYTTELRNHSLDASDVGTIWFDDSSAEAKVVSFLHDNAARLGLRAAETSFLDLGTGNGHLLFAAREPAAVDGDGVDDEDEDDEDDEDEDGDEVVCRKDRLSGGGRGGNAANSSRATGFRGRMLGVDYSAQSVELAQQIAAAAAAAAKSTTAATATATATAATPASAVEFRVWDLLRDDPALVLDGAQHEGWDVVLDKGTFDAVSLSEEVDRDTGRRVCEGYRGRVTGLVRVGGYFLITSCNWTEEELRGWFEASGEVEGKEEEEGEEEVGGPLLEFAEAIRYKSFSFGGKKGQTVCSVCFRRSR